MRAFIIIRAIPGLVLISLLGGIVWFWISLRPIPQPPGILIKHDPQQITCAPLSLPDVAGYNLSAIASYHLQGRVLGTKRYYSSHSDLVPIDVALGWGRMSDTSVLSSLTVSQSNRFYFYEWQQNNPPIPKEEMICHSANNHVIAADRRVAAFIRALKPGHLVDLRGFLVSAKRGDFSWRSSLSRTDSGNGACELFYVTQAKMFDGRSDLTDERIADRSAEAVTSQSVIPSSETPPNLEHWYAALNTKRKTLDVSDPVAVRVFNEEAQRYTIAVHTGRDASSIRPAATIPITRVTEIEITASNSLPGHQH